MDKIDKSIGGWNARLNNMEYKVNELVEGYNEIMEIIRNLSMRLDDHIEDHE